MDIAVRTFLCHDFAKQELSKNVPRPQKEKRPAVLIGAADLAEMVDGALPKPGKRGPYRKRIAA
jgi:hypothetical protein